MAEDDEDDYLLSKDAFERCCPGIELLWVRDGEELMDYLNRRGSFNNGEKFPMPALILLDLNMPRKDGREALREIKADPRLRSLPVVILTTSNAEEEIARAYDSGANTFIRKPVGFDQFVDLMTGINHYWLKLARLPVVQDS